MQDYLCLIPGRDKQRRAQIRRFGKRTRYCAQITPQTCRHNTDLLEGVTTSNSRLLGYARLSIVVGRCFCSAGASSSAARFSALLTETIWRQSREVVLAKYNSQSCIIQCKCWTQICGGRNYLSICFPSRGTHLSSLH